MPLTPTEPRLSYELAGNHGPQVLLIMGLGMKGRVWEPQIQDLSTDHRLATFDNRGIGASAAMAGRPRISDLADDAARVADAAGFSSFHLVGVSLGGMIAQELTLRHPERIASLTLIATLAGGPLGLAPRPAGLWAFVRSLFGPRSQRLVALQKLLYTPEFLAEVDKARLDARMKLQVGERAHPRTVLSQLYAAVRHDTRERLRDIRARTLIVRPGKDILIRPKHSDLLHRSIPRARLLDLPGAGHGVTFQNAGEVSAAVRAHVAESEAEGLARA